MAYTPNPADPTQPTDAISAETAQAEFRALKAYIQNLVSIAQSWDPNNKSVNTSLSSGNTVATNNTTPGGGVQNAVKGLYSKSSGKWYWEVKINAEISASAIIGIGNAVASLANFPGKDVNSYGYDTNNGHKWVNNVSTALGAALAVGDVLGLAFDAGGHTLQLFKNNVSQGTIAGLTAGAYFPMISMLSATDSLFGIFDKQALTFAPPATFSAFYDSAAGASTISSPGAVKGAFKNLKIIVSDNTHLTISYDEAALESSSNVYTTVRAGSHIINTAVNGLNGLDTGAMANNTFYFVHLISDGLTPGALLSLSATAPTLPVNYIYQARMGAVISAAAADLKRTLQYGKSVQYVPTAATNTLAYPTAASGVQGTITSGAFTPVATSVATIVPSTAFKIKLMTSNGGLNAGSLGVAPNTLFGGTSSTTQPPITTQNPVTVQVVLNEDMILESTNIQYASNFAQALVQCIGWEDNIP